MTPKTSPTIVPQRNEIPADATRPWPPNFEHFEFGRASINFNVFKVASTGPCRHTNIENFEVGGGTSSLKMLKVEPGPGIIHDTHVEPPRSHSPLSVRRPKSGRPWQGKLSAALIPGPKDQR